MLGLILDFPIERLSRMTDWYRKKSKTLMRKQQSFASRKENHFRTRDVIHYVEVV